MSISFLSNICTSLLTIEISESKKLLTLKTRKLIFLRPFNTQTKGKYMQRLKVRAVQLSTLANLLMLRS